MVDYAEDVLQQDDRARLGHMHVTCRTSSTDFLELESGAEPLLKCSLKAEPRLLLEAIPPEALQPPVLSLIHCPLQDDHRTIVRETEDRSTEKLAQVASRSPQ